MRTTEPVRGLLWFAVFGLAGLSFDVALLALLRHFTALPDLAAVALAFIATYLINFFLNRRFSFAGEGAQAGPLRGQLLRFLPQVSLDFVLTLTAVELLSGLGVQLLLARVLAGGSNATINYVMYRWWTFRPRRPRRPAHPDPGSVRPPESELSSSKSSKSTETRPAPESPTGRLRPEPGAWSKAG